MCHVLFLHLLDGNLLPCFLVHSQLDEAKLAFAECLSYLIILKDVSVSHSQLQPWNPILLLFNRSKEHEAWLVRRDDYLDWIVTLPLWLTTRLVWVLVRDFIVSDISEVGSCKTVHYFVILLATFPVEVELVSNNNHPMLFETFSLSFQKAMSLVLVNWLVFTITEPL